MSTRMSSLGEDPADPVEALRAAQELVAFLGDSMDTVNPEEGAVTLVVRDDATVAALCKLLNDVQERVAAALAFLEGAPPTEAVEVLQRLRRS